MCSLIQIHMSVDSYVSYQASENMHRLVLETLNFSFFAKDINRTRGSI